MDRETQHAQHPQHAQRFPASSPQAAVILGNDALVAACPSTADQLARACRGAGFDIVVPPTCGDEIVAGAYLERFAHCPDRAAIACACPHVRSIVHPTQNGALPCVEVASPPVAAARYLRTVHGNELLVTYVGDCPGATDPVIDARFSPSGFLASLHRQGISVSDQPVVDMRDDPTWARHLSTPGGLPARRFIARPPVGRVVREVELDALATALRSSRSGVVVDLAGALGCVCAANGDAISAYEPVRSALPVVAVPPSLDLTARPTPPRSRASLRARDGMAIVPTTPAFAGTVGHAETIDQNARHTPPRSRDDATLPASPTEVDRTPGSHVRSDSEPEASAPRHVAGATAAETPVGLQPATAPRSRRVEFGPIRLQENRREPERSRPGFVPVPPWRTASRGTVQPSRGLGLGVLVALPLIVLAILTALGVAVYAKGSSSMRGGDGRAADSSLVSDAAVRDSARAENAAAPLRPESLTSSGVVGTTAAPNPVARADSSEARADTVQRVRPRRAPQVVPGWLPQGQGAWTPDTARSRPDSATLPARRVPPA